jgi:hypothetical protein
MSLTDLAETKPKRVEIRGKLRHALDAMVWEGLEYNEAARKFNFHVRSMRNALSRPAVQAYLRAERVVLRESMSPRNIHRLREIRDAADNMPAVQAIRTLEGMGDDQHAGTSKQSLPGLVVQINVGSDPRQSTVVTDARNTIEHDQ